jgi:hypothetical protein
VRLAHESNPDGLYAPATSIIVLIGRRVRPGGRLALGGASMGAIGGRRSRLLISAFYRPVVVPSRIVRSAKLNWRVIAVAAARI